MKYARLFNGQIEYAQPTFLTEEGTYILNFDQDINLMSKFGFKCVIDEKPDYDVGTEMLNIVGFSETATTITIEYIVIPQPNEEPTVEEKVETLVQKEIQHAEKIQLLEEDKSVKDLQIKTLEEYKTTNDNKVLELEKSRETQNKNISIINKSLEKSNTAITTLENNISTSNGKVQGLEETQLNQDMQIIQNMLGTAEVCDMVLALQDSLQTVLPIKKINLLNLGGNNMVDIYANLVLLGKYTVVESEAINGVKLVPAFYRDKVIERLNEWK